MNVSALTVLAFSINSAIDTGQYDDVTIVVVREKVRSGAILNYLEEKLVGDIDLSILDDTMRAALLEEWRDMEAAINIRRTFRIEWGGLTLIMAFLLEGIQRRIGAKA